MISLDILLFVKAWSQIILVLLPHNRNICTECFVAVSAALTVVVTNEPRHDKTNIVRLQPACIRTV
jgi:hypothetical protein